jgi:hypothetical protein
MSPRKERMDCFVASAARNDGERSLPVIASEAKQSIARHKEKMDASSQ